jgi:hypothetical protein
MGIKMTEHKVWTFFYGSYINPNVLSEVKYIPDRSEVARLNGYDIRIQPLANLEFSEKSCVYGIVASGTHEELRRLYSHAENVLGEKYLPEAVIVQTLEGRFLPALCYIAPSMESKPADNEYIDRIVGPAREYGFPSWYIDRLESFRPCS